MSRHAILTNFQGKPLELILGWDRLSQQFFMAVMPSQSEEDEDEDADETPFDSAVAEIMSYSLFGENAGSTVSEFQAVLARLAIPVPPKAFIEVEKDSNGNVGNRMEIYGYS